MAYTDFIPQNIAPQGTKQIVIFNEQGKQVGKIPLESLTPPNPALKLYTFGIGADIHNDTISLSNALIYLKKTEIVEFVILNGDLTNNGIAGEFEEYKKCVETSGATVYAIPGNHDAPSNDNSVTDEASIVGLEFDALRPYTGQGLYYSFTHGDDVYILVGEWAWSYKWPFSIAEMQWLYETLEANRNKRCFVFQHLMSFDGSGNPYPGVSPTTDILGCENTSHYSNVPGRIFLSLIRHYKNCIWFHAHSHTTFECQTDNTMANYDKYYGIHSVHVPSLSATRVLENSVYVELPDSSEGYVVDVYPNGIHLRGRDFVKGEFLPIASYWLDTTLQTIPVGTYIDPTGTIKT